MKFNHLNVPSHWQNYWTRYPEGHTILEAIISWVSQVDNMVDNQNNLNDNVAQFRNEIDAFVARFDDRLQDEVTQTLSDWQSSGFLDVVINEALDTKYHEMDDRLTTQMAQTETEMLNKQRLTFTKTHGDWSARPLVSFTDDDGVGTPLLNQLAPVFTSRNVPLGVALINSMNAMVNPTQRDQLLDLQNNHGWEILCHGWDDQTFHTQSEQQLRDMFERSKKDFAEKGFNVESAIYPMGGMSPLSKSITGDYFRAGFTTNPLTSDLGSLMNDQRTIDLYGIRRVNIGEYGNTDFNKFKELIDHAKANNQWLVFYTHSWAINTNLPLLEGVIDYVRTQGIEIVTPSKALTYFEPAIQTGGYNTYDKFTKILKNGEINSTSAIQLEVTDVYSASDPISKYKNPINIFGVTSANAVSLGWGSAGTVLTIKGFFVGGYDYQFFMDYNTNLIKFRHTISQTNQTWSIWDTLQNERTNGTVRLNDNAFTSGEPITSYPNLKESIFASSGSGQGFPTANGFVKTYRFGVDTWSRQEYRPMRTNDLWSRFIDSQGNWSEWTKVIGV